MRKRTQVIIIGGGPSGLILGQLLHQSGIETVIIEAKTKAHVLSRVRAGVLERGLVDLLERAGVGDAVRSNGMQHDGIAIAAHDEVFRIGIRAATGSPIYVYGQSPLTRDLYAAREAFAGTTVFEASDVEITGVETSRPEVHYTDQHGRHQIVGDFVIGCDGFHGVSRRAIPAQTRREFQQDYPYSWLGVLSESPPVRGEVLYATSSRGFALCSMRSDSLSRYYIQIDNHDTVEQWNDQAFWDALRRRLPEHIADEVRVGPVIEKSSARLRSFVCEPMQHGSLFLCGDAAHIVPPTGAKGLNTAASDVYYLHQALENHYTTGDRAALDGYSERALARVWQTQRFSRWFTRLLHLDDRSTDIGERERLAELRYLQQSPAAQQVFAENYAGLPYETAPPEGGTA